MDMFYHFSLLPFLPAVPDTAFNQNISAWNTSFVVDMEDMFLESGLRSCPSWAVAAADGPCWTE